MAAGYQDIVREDRVLADKIKNTHKILRNSIKQCEKKNQDEIWKSHVNQLFQSDSASEYANSMKTLSNTFWKNESRLEWISSKLKLYFIQRDIERFLKRLHRKQELSEEKEEEEFNRISEIFPKNTEKIKILDVGSCHNPLLKFFSNEDNRFDLMAIDLSPACDTVLRGDFIQIPLNDENHEIIENDLVNLKRNSFEAVIFCLLLEYLPTAELRLKAVEKAIDLLKPFGVLFIVTPDSSHQGKNQNQMKSWRLAMAKLGMIRIYIDKLKHVTCLGYVKIEQSRCGSSEFEKVFQSEIGQIQKKFDNYTDFDIQTAFYIPQDL